MEKAASAVVRRATDSTGVTLLPPDFLLTMYCCGSEVTDSEDTGAIYSAEREREKDMNTEEKILSSGGCENQFQAQNLHLLVSLI